MPWWKGRVSFQGKPKDSTYYLVEEFEGPNGGKGECAKKERASLLLKKSNALEISSYCSSESVIHVGTCSKLANLCTAMLIHIMMCCAPSNTVSMTKKSCE
jgi:hypothetical protein